MGPLGEFLRNSPLGDKILRVLHGLGASAGPQRRASRIGRTGYKYLTLKILKIENAQKISFLTQNGQKLTLKTVKMSKILTEDLNFGSHLSTFGDENTPKSGPFKT